MPQHRLISLTLLAATILAGCQNSGQTPPPAPELVGGPCKYDETPAIAVVSDATSDQVRFLIDGRVVPYARQDLPAQFQYTPGMKFSVVEKRITEGTCTPYILEVVGPAASGQGPGPSGRPMNRTQKQIYPDPSLR